MVHSYTFTWLQVASYFISQNNVNSLHWRHNGREFVSNHQPYDCLLNPLFRRRSKKTSKLCITGLCEGNSPRTSEFPAQWIPRSWPSRQLLYHFNCLTLNVRGPSYLGLTRSISWLLMPWLLKSPGHQQPWDWLYKICRSFSYSRKYLCDINEDEWHKMYIYVMFPLKNLIYCRLEIGKTLGMLHSF